MSTAVRTSKRPAPTAGRPALTGSEIAFNIVNYTFFALLTFVCIYPFYYLFINTISDNTLATQGHIMFYPRGIHFANYVQVIKLRGLAQAALISVSRTVIGSVLTVFASAFVGYLVTKERMWKRKIWYRFIIVTMYFNAGIIPWYILMMNLHLTNNFLAYVIPGIVSPFNIVLVKTFVESIPPALEDSAQIDGAGYLMRFAKVVFPLCMPILATITVFSAVGQWNSFQDTLLLMTDPDLYTLQFILYNYINQANSLAKILAAGGSSSEFMANLARTQTPTTVRMTVSMVVVAPILVVYPFFQRYFVGGIMIGAVKG